MIYELMFRSDAFLSFFLFYYEIHVFTTISFTNIFVQPRKGFSRWISKHMDIYECMKVTERTTSCLQLMKLFMDMLGNRKSDLNPFR